MTTKRHTVKPGEHLSGIASRYGFPDYKPIWTHSDNAELRKKRKDPHVLYEGDVVVIPEGRPKTLGKPTGATHKFKVKGSDLTLELKMLDEWDKPIANAFFAFREDSRDEQGNVTAVIGEDGQTKADGRASLGINHTSFEAELRIFESKPLPDPIPPPPVIHKFDLFIGGLDPICERSGMRARLNNLGYFAGLTDGPNDREQLRWAIEEFQFDNKIVPQNGDLDDPKNKARIKQTREKLVKVHGDDEPVACTD